MNGNNNPGDNNESQPTPITLPPTNSSFFIPEGFSPNGDGVNDRFVIRGATGLTISLEVYNRWGHVVYKNDNYQNDWDGTANTGILLDGDKGLPDGTYYYIVRTSDGRRFVRYMTIYR
jgi:gliding motility-associated-like protein